MKQLRCVFYVRVSTTGHGQDPTMQTNDLKPFAAQRGWELVGEYTDYCTGSKESRPELNRLLADAKLGKFDIVVVWKLDRYARSLKQLVNSVAAFAEQGVQFVSVKDDIDLTTASGRLMFHVISAMAEFERSLIQERVRAGLRNARAKGKVLGRAKGSIDPTATSRTTLWRRTRALAATMVN